MLTLRVQASAALRVARESWTLWQARRSLRHADETVVLWVALAMDEEDELDEADYDG